ncbi:MAG: GMP synthase (glutamine-hydrolyzing), partial [Alphaproteobacteria bacterium]|nr:GMP synthase (glutamine-hydrolyzing) [Alphaproteobacteria bacterium]
MSTDNTSDAPDLEVHEQHEHILILDFGSQVTQLIARRLRESGVYCEIWPFNHADEDRIKAFDPKGIILSGGPCSVLDDDAPSAPDIVFEMGVPVFGICYGQQTMVQQLGGKVEGEQSREFGRATVEVVDESKIAAGVWSPGNQEQVWMS